MLLHVFSELHFITLLGGLCFISGASGFDQVKHLPCTSTPSLSSFIVWQMQRVSEGPCRSIGRSKTCRSLRKMNTKALSIPTSSESFDSLIHSFLAWVVWLLPLHKTFQAFRQRGLIPFYKK